MSLDLVVCVINTVLVAGIFLLELGAFLRNRSVPVSRTNEQVEEPACQPLEPSDREKIHERV